MSPGPIRLSHQRSWAFGPHVTPWPSLNLDHDHRRTEDDGQLHLRQNQCEALLKPASNSIHFLSLKSNNACTFRSVVHFHILNSPRKRPLVQCLAFYRMGSNPTFAATLHELTPQAPTLLPPPPLPAPDLGQATLGCIRPVATAHPDCRSSATGDALIVRLM